MGNQEAIEILKIERNHMIPTLFTERIEAMDMAISALQALDEIYAFIMKSEASETTDGVLEIFDALQAQEVETCNQLATDCISRQAAIDEWKNDFKGYVNALNIPRDDYTGIMEYIDELPSAQPDRSLWFRIGEICVDESKGFISAGRAVEKIRELLREAERREDE